MMRRFSTIVWVIILVVFSKGNILGQGTATILFLRTGISASAAGLGGAYTAVVGDENSMFFNPAGMLHFSGLQLSFNHTEWFESIRFDNVSLGLPLGNSMGAAGAFSYMWMPPIPGYDANGQPTGSFTVSSWVGQIGFAYQVVRGFRLGVNGKFFQDQLASYKAQGVAFDVGFQVDSPWPFLQIGGAVQNLGQPVRHFRYKEPLPQTYRAGVALRFPRPGIRFLLDGVKSIDTHWQVHAGLEYNFRKIVFLRIGNSPNGRHHFSLSYGIGLQWQEKYRLDYTLAQLPYLGLTHRVGIHLQLGGGSSSASFPSVRTAPPVKASSNAITIRLQGERLVLSWPDVGAEGYYIYGRLSPQKPWKRLTAQPVVSNRKVYRKPPKAGEYYFKVTAIVDGQEKEIFQSVSIYVP